jgi:hypothetical protein
VGERLLAKAEITSKSPGSHSADRLPSGYGELTRSRPPAVSGQDLTKVSVLSSENKWTRLAAYTSCCLPSVAQRFNIKRAHRSPFVTDLGKGGVGEVWACRSQRSGRVYAVKWTKLTGDVPAGEGCGRDITGGLKSVRISVRDSRGHARTHPNHLVTDSVRVTRTAIPCHPPVTHCHSSRLSSARPPSPVSRESASDRYVPRAVGVRGPGWSCGTSRTPTWWHGWATIRHHPVLATAVRPGRRLSDGHLVVTLLTWW